LGVEPSGTDIAMGTDITNQLINTTNTVQEVSYHFTYRLNDPRSGNTPFCDHGIDTTITVYVNPTPRFTVTIADTIVCDSTVITLEVTDGLGAVQGTKVYDLQTTYTPGAVLGVEPSGTDIAMGTDITNQLINTTNTVQEVSYHFTYRLNDPRSGNTPFCDHGIDTTITVYVNPTPLMYITVADTLCDSTYLTFHIVSGNGDVIGDKMFYVETTYIQDSVQNVHSSGYFTLQDFTDYLINNSIDLQVIRYRFIPVIMNFRENEPDFGCNHFNDTIIDIYLNPTPRIFVSIPDTIYCNESEIDFTVINNQVTTGVIVYDLEVTGDLIFITGQNPDGRYGIDDFRDTLTNSDTYIRQLIYTFKPVIQDAAAGLECGKGISRSIVVRVVPTLAAVAVSDTFYGAWNISCYGFSNGSIDLSPYGGYYPKPYQFTWSTAGGSGLDIYDEDQSGLTAGKYYYLIEDLIGCSYFDSITLTQPAVIAVSADIDPVSCNGKNDGSIDLTVTGGTGGIYGYSYDWWGPDFQHRVTQDLINEYSGDWDLTLKDKNNCTYHSVYVINAPETIIITLNREVYGNYNISCNGRNDGSILTSVTGGTPGYTYQWYNSSNTLISTNKDLYTLTAGFYRLRVTDIQGCYSDQTTTLAQPAVINIQKVNGTYPGGFDISCYDRQDGAITIKLTGGHTTYLDNDFLWTTADGSGLVPADSNQVGLTDGTYNVLVTDAFNCTGTKSFTLTQPTQIRLQIDDVSDYNGWNIRCHSNNDGNIQISSSGGVEPHNYFWTSSDGTVPEPALQDQNDLIAGEYHLKITDDISCTYDTVFILAEPDTIDVNPVISSYSGGYEIDCYGSTSGSIQLNPSGGAALASNSYSWTTTDGSGLQTSAIDQTGLTAGSYEVSITDINNCSGEWAFTLTEPDSVYAEFETDPATCFRSPNASIDMTVFGGVPDYSYLWSNGATSQDLSMVLSATYYVEISDQNGCKKQDSVFVGEADEMLTGIHVVTDYNGRDISCYGRSDASVDFEVAGGTPPYQYSWSNGSSTEDLENLPAGWYVVDVSDVYNCEKKDSIEVIEPDPVALDMDLTDPACYGDSTGQISLLIYGGTPGYSVNWNNGMSGSIIGHLPAGSYQAIVYDLNNCYLDTSSILNQPEALSLSFETSPAYCGDTEDGTIGLDINGGTLPYSINWSDGLDGEQIEGVRAGTYTILISDDHGCTLSDTIIVEKIYTSCLTIPNAFTPNGDGFNDTWEIRNIELYPEASLRIFNRWGETVFYTESGYENNWNGTYRGRELPIDSYHYILDLNNGEPPITGNITLIR
ncbi:MAG: gliding motility-associated C-terminal domain-containing protein, partial [Bacteroidota bacterium]